MVKEQQATGWGTSDDADGFGATGEDLLGGLFLGEWVRLPVLLIGAFIAVDSNEAPGDRQLLKLFQE